MVARNANCQYAVVLYISSTYESLRHSNTVLGHMSQYIIVDARVPSGHIAGRLSQAGPLSLVVRGHRPERFGGGQQLGGQSLGVRRRDAGHVSVAEQTVGDQGASVIVRHGTVTDN